MKALVVIELQHDRIRLTPVVGLTPNDVKDDPKNFCLDLIAEDLCRNIRDFVNGVDGVLCVTANNRPLTTSKPTKSSS